MIKFLFAFYARASPSFRRRIIGALPLVRWMFSPWLRATRIGAYRLIFDPSDNASFRYKARGENYEKTLVTACLRALSLNPGAIFIDVGASYGFFTLAAANFGRFGAVRRIFAFEVDERCSSCLARSIRSNGWDRFIELRTEAVGDYVGTTKLFLSENASTSNRTFQSTERSLKFQGTKNVHAVTLDSFIPEFTRAGAKIFIIKVDVEGSELRVFRGARKLLSECEGFLMVFECYPAGMEEVGVDVRELLEFIDGLPITIFFRESGDCLEVFRTKKEFLDNITAFAMLAPQQRQEVARNYLFGRDILYTSEKG